MYQSLLQNCSNAHLFVFAFDDTCYNFLKEQNYPSLTVISLSEFEDEELLKIKNQRSAAEYCWSCTPSTILYAIEKYKLDNCTYVDADMQFFSNPAIIWEESIDKSVLITSHNYTVAYDQSVVSGIYCVQFVGFLNDSNGMRVLQWWRKSCIEWCYARSEDGKFGDQKYLDNWVTKFEGVHVVKNFGAGIAPWNCQQCNFQMKNGKINAHHIGTSTEFNVVFYHFHGVVFFKNETLILSGDIYKLNEDVIRLFYIPYIRGLQDLKIKIEPHFTDKDTQGSKDILAMKPGLFYKITLLVNTLKSFLKNLLAGTFKFTPLFNHYYFINKFTGRK